MADTKRRAGLGLYDEATQEAAVKLQQMRGWPITGCVSEREWNEVIGDDEPQ